jgi:serine/threonine protein kinase
MTGEKTYAFFAPARASIAETGGVAPESPTVFQGSSHEDRPAGAATGSELPCGKTIPGTHYRVISKLGEGGMGTVYLAEHMDIGRRVALKILHGNLVRDPLALGQFRQEARTGSRIGSPYVCDVTDWGATEDGRVFFVMEYVRGATLGSRLKDERCLTLARAIPVLRQVAKALGAAHAAGMVHLDVKPDNVMLTEKQERRDWVKMLDFGIARILGRGRGAGSLMGTPLYMSPERARGLPCDHRADVYSLGIMTWEMLAGDVPFDAPNPVEILALQVGREPERINQRLKSPVPRGMEALILQMLEKDPAKRPQSMAEIEAQLIEAQIEARIRTPWDAELTLPQMSPHRRARLARALAPIARRARLSPRTIPIAALLGLMITLLGIDLHVRQLEPPGPAQVLSTLLAIPSPPTTIAAFSRLASEAPTPSAAAPLLLAEASPLTAEAPPLPAVVGPVWTAGTDGDRPASAQAMPRRHRSHPMADPAAVVPPAPGDALRAKEAAARGALAFETGQIKQAEKEFRDALAADPRDVAALIGLAGVEFENANYEAAWRWARAAVVRAPANPEYQLLLGHAYFKVGRFEDAMGAYDRALSLSPHDSNIASSVARARARLEATVTLSPRVSD